METEIGRLDHYSCDTVSLTDLPTGNWHVKTTSGADWLMVMH